VCYKGVNEFFFVPKDLKGKETRNKKIKKMKIKT